MIDLEIRTNTVCNGFSALLTSNNKIHVQDLKSTQEKLQTLVKGGPENLQILADFDHTFSKYHANGKPCSTLHNVFNQPKYKSIGDQLWNLRLKYVDMEFSSEIPTVEKLPHMEEWWQTGHDIIVSGNFTKSDLREAIETSTLTIRDGGIQFLKILNSHQIPTVIFSAGIADFIEIVLEKEMVKVPENVLIVSNRIVYDQETHERVAGFSDPLVHTFNKNPSVISLEDRETLDKFSPRSNTLLLGDSLNDANMDLGGDRSDDEMILKIGFLNRDFEKNLPIYAGLYDIVLIDDQTFDVPLAIVKLILGE